MKKFNHNIDNTPTFASNKQMSIKEKIDLKFSEGKQVAVKNEQKDVEDLFAANSRPKPSPREPNKSNGYAANRSMSGSFNIFTQKRQDADTSVTVLSSRGTTQEKRNSVRDNILFFERNSHQQNTEKMFKLNSGRLANTE